ncbi:MAG: HD domain-containing protein [Thermodesulfobacteriota bacterium]|nr:HD domain-containing protein [Thermodesulfobacteriota bacterium]
MNEEIVEELENWFAGYVQKFKSGNPDWQPNIILKEEHTRRVCKEILGIGRKIGLSDEDLCLAKIIALFHDIGRFEQFARYQTFVDRNSVNHAVLGVKILKENGVLNRLDRSVRDLILRAILYHNRFALPKKETEKCLFFAKLLRDADKLDIWRVVTDYYHQKDGKRNAAIELGLPDTPGISSDVYRDLIERRIVNVTHLKNLNDFKLLQIGWIYDINFVQTFRCVQERGYLEMIRDVLPKSEKIAEIFNMLQAHMNEKIQGKRICDL